VGGLHLPHMGKLGIGHITDIKGVPPEANPTGCYGKMQPKSAGKDTISGHWELMGIYLPTPLPTYSNGFPESVIKEYERRIGRQVIGNKPASGTEILKELGEEHVTTGKPIVYTSADSVFQIAAHENVIPINELYRMCEIAREILRGDHAVGRVIARPFLGETAETFKRTERRKDYPLLPSSDTMLDKLANAGKTVYSIGKIDDIFGRRGITKSKHTVYNKESTLALLDSFNEEFEGLLFANLIEFDMIYGHRNDARGYANALEDFDRHIPEILKQMRYTDIAMVVADHGVDPTTPGTDHTRENIPLLVFGPQVNGRANLGTRKTFSDVAATIAELFTLSPPEFGTSFVSELVK
ncbi:MAG TPA: phosphopentomutase, partial [Anaerolineales bacterium]|nr:phosphopentomutase [Anaerolineales bacterium]